jgi:hypothetical protein
MPRSKTGSRKAGGKKGVPRDAKGKIISYSKAFNPKKNKKS